jgi:hypothetical protein
MYNCKTEARDKLQLAGKVQDSTESDGNENAVENTSKCCQYKTSWIINHLHKTTEVRTAKRILQHRPQRRQRDEGLGENGTNTWTAEVSGMQSGSELAEEHDVPVVGK